MSCTGHNVWLSCRTWSVSNGLEEICVGRQPDGRCKTLNIPDCEDRTIRCSAVPNLWNGVKVILNEIDPDDHTVYGTRFTVGCTEKNFYFDYSVPDDLISFYFSNNINLTTFYCNMNGYEQSWST